MLIPRVDKKIHVLNFKSQSSHLIQQTKQDLLLLQAACAELKGSEKFVKILEAVLVVGNHLNGDSSRGHAKGFKLDALLKLMDVKGSNRETTLLHFVVVQLVKVDEQILSLPEELKSMKPASFVKLESIRASINDLEHGLKITEEEIGFARTDLSIASSSRSKFLDSMLPFLKDRFVHVVELKELLNITLQKLKDVFEYFGESGNEEAPRQMDLFRTMHQFLNMFHQVSKEIQEVRSSLKVEQRKVKSSNDKKTTSFALKEGGDGRVKPGVIENIVHSRAMSGNDRGESETYATRKKEISIATGSADSICGRKDQQSTSCIEEVVAKDESSTPSKSIAPHIVGYDSDWSTC